MKKNVLFISSSIGLGHAARDLAIAREMKKRNPDIEISWLAGDPALTVIKEAGEKLLPECELLGKDSYLAEKVSNGFGLNVNKYLFTVLLEWRKSIMAIRRLTKEKKFDLIIADEAYELILAFLFFPGIKKKAPFVMIYDFFGFDATTKNPFEKLGTYFWNFAWVTGNRTPWVENLSLFVGNAEDIADKSYGLFLPNARRHAEKHYKFLGNILPFNPQDYSNTAEVKSRLGYGAGHLIICSVGGTSIGVDLLNLCSRTYRILKDKLPMLQMVLICGPRIDSNSIKVTEGIQIKGYVPKLYEHFAACDLAIVQGGGTTTTELAALNKNFLYFPLEEHFEQKLVSDKLKRLGAGVNMRFSETDEITLSKAVLENLGKTVDHQKLDIDGAVKAAEIIQPFL
ncbi:glycosyltransferase [Neobacillus sp. NPDC093127]|uniref:glycosyltransferase n=1 Tax=Neobacillus sp. NPDC093127 TaxID=3364296 RepID=UPI0037FC99B0